MAPTSTSLAGGTSGKPVAFEVALPADASVVLGGLIPAQSNEIGLAISRNVASLTKPPERTSAAGIIVAGPKQAGPKSSPTSTGALLHQCASASSPISTATRLLTGSRPFQSLAGSVKQGLGRQEVSGAFVRLCRAHVRRSYKALLEAL